MNSKIAQLLVRLYPRSWRERYGAEFEEFLETGGSDPRTMANVAWSAFNERITPTAGLTMNTNTGSFLSFARRPSAFFPLVMSLTGLAVVLCHAAVYGITHDVDEGATAHIWQLLTAAQLPAIAFFAIKWLPRARRQALLMLALLAATSLANFAAVYFLT